MIHNTRKTLKDFKMPYPLLFKPVYRDYIWGGDRIASAFSRDDAPTPCAESWEISSHPDGVSVIENGSLAGKTLQQACDEGGAAFLGAHCTGDKFPLLIKLIDAKTRLSVQVHPDEEAAERYGGEPKTEMWYVLDADKESFLCAGFKQGIGPRAFQDAIKANSVPSTLRTIKAEPGKAVYIPGGLVHAICEGCLILEVQQSSNTTYRVYDWGRVDANGKPRTLHVNEAINATNWKAETPGMQTPIPMTAANPANVRERIMRSDFFTMERLTLNDAEQVEPDGNSFRAIFVSSGEVEINWGAGATLRIPHGRSCLVPANMPPYSLRPFGDSATLLLTEV